jgi:hypothetical protein
MTLSSTANQKKCTAGAAHIANAAETRQQTTSSKSAIILIEFVVRFSAIRRKYDSFRRRASPWLIPAVPPSEIPAPMAALQVDRTHRLEGQQS